jgi:ankyrin repeat protein
MRKLVVLILLGLQLSSIAKAQESASRNLFLLSTKSVKVDIYKKSTRDGSIYLCVTKETYGYGSKFKETELSLLIKQSGPDRVRYVLEEGADPNQPNYDGLTPLDLAKKLKKQEMVDILLEFGADPSIKSNLVTAWWRNQFDLDPKLCQNFKKNKKLMFESLEIEEETKDKLINDEIYYGLFKGDKCVLVFLTPYKYETLD